QTARSQLQTIKFFRDPFKLVPVNNIADIADKFTRNEVMTSNEIRQIIGMKPSDDPKADELRNSNLNHPDEQTEQKSVINTDRSTTTSELSKGKVAVDSIIEEQQLLQGD